MAEKICECGHSERDHINGRCWSCLGGQAIHPFRPREASDG